MPVLFNKNLLKSKLLSQDFSIDLVIYLTALKKI